MVGKLGWVMQKTVLREKAESRVKPPIEPVTYFVECYFEWKELRLSSPSGKLLLFEKLHGTGFVQLLEFFDGLVKA